MKPILVTMGEPAGVGPDICIALQDVQATHLPFVVIGDEKLLASRARMMGRSISHLNILHMEGLGEVTPGMLDVAHAEYVMRLLEKATALCLAGEYSGLVTAPVHKAILNQAGFDFTGHTEFLAHACGVDEVVMLLASSEMRVALVTTHLPLRAVPDAITESRLLACIRILNTALQEDFGIHRPKIGVAGLNPHAGEDGYLGREEIDIMIPVIEKLRAEGLDVSLPKPADTLFTKASGAHFDVLLAMYHDQGLPVLKHASFGEASNITLGLPIVRTSVDHGTALLLAGSGAANPASLMVALNMAHQMACARERFYA